MEAVLAALAITVMVAGCGAAQKPSAAPKTHKASVTQPQVFDIRGSIEAGSGTAGRPGQPCYTEDGYNDISRGTDVTVSDASGKIVGLGSLYSGKYAELASMTRSIMCKFTFTVSDVAEGSQFYSVEVAHRGELRYTRDDLNKPLHFALGSKYGPREKSVTNTAR